MGSGQGTDLVSQLKADEALRASEQQASQRRRRARRFVALIITVVVLAAAGIAGKLAFDRYQAAALVAKAGERLHGATSAGLTEAEQDLDSALALVKGDADALTMRAVVRGHSALLYGGDIEALATAVQEAQAAGGNTFHVRLSEAMLNLGNGEVGKAAEALAALGEAPSDSSMLGHSAWLTGLVSLAQPHERASVEASAAALAEYITADSPWVVYRRTHAELVFVSGDARTALDETVKAREAAPAELGHAVDELVYNAYLHEATKSVEANSTQLMERPEDLQTRDIGRLHLARGLARIHAGERDGALEDLSSAWKAAPEWDVGTKQEVLTQLQSLGAADEAADLLEGGATGIALPEVYEASIKLSKLDSAGALEALAKLDQGHAEVGYLQALALTEQLRFEEARPWIDRAKEFFPHRVELQVADLRVTANGEDGKAAEPKLAELSDAHPHAPRVWTSLGEARMAAEDAAGSKKAFRRALKREGRPAQAHLHLASLVDGDVHRSADTRAEVRKHLEDAIAQNEHIPRYKAALAEHLMYVGDEAAGIELMRKIAEDPLVDPETLLDLAAYESQHVGADKDKLGEIEKLLDRAETQGTDPFALVRERARLDIARGTPESVAKARGAVEPLIAERSDDIELRLVYLASLMAQEDYSAAAENARAGIRRNPKNNGRLFFAWAEAERKKDNDRSAARQTLDGWDKLVAEQPSARVILDGGRLSVRLWLGLRKEDVARRVARKLTQALPNSAEAWAIRAKLEMDTKREDNGCESANSGINLEPTHHQIHAVMARCHAFSGRRAQAKAEYQKAAELAKGLPAAKRYLKRAKAL
jgi:tetratricopeptide (TPR) repeat protein